MAKAPLDFPPSAADLGGMANADLVQLVKQEGVAHPQGKSLAHFMSKPDKVAYLGAHHYKTGVDVSHVIPNAESKYADFLAKAKAKNEAAKIATPTGTNCSATAMKDLEAAVAQIETLGSLPPLQVLEGDITTFFAGHPDLFAEAKAASDGGVSLIGNLAQYGMQLKSQVLAVSTEAGEIEVANALTEATKAAIQVLTNDTTDVAGLLKVAKGVDDVAPIFGTDPIGAGLQVLSAQAKGAAEKASQDYLVDKLTSSGFMSLPTDVSGNVAVLKDLAEIDAKMLTAVTQESFEQAVKQTALNTFKGLIDVTAEPTSPGLLDAAQMAVTDVGKLIKSPEVQKGLDTVLQTASHQASSVAWESAKPEFEALKNIDLKKLAYQELDNHGLQKSLGSFLTKDEKVELLAKFKTDQPVDDLVAKAKEKYLIKEGKLPAPGEAKDIASTTVKAPEVKAAEAVVDPTKAEFDLAKALEESGEQHLAPVEEHGLIETEPHPVEKVTHVFTPTGKGPGAGSHPMEIFVDENGDKWLFKVQGQWQSEVEDWAAQVGEKLGLNVTEVRVEQNVATSLYGVKDGSFQRMMPNVGELGKEGQVLTKLTEEQVKELQRQQVYDWLISNHDSHGENFLLAHDGGLIPIDKGQAMKFFGTDTLSATYSPNNSQPVYNGMWKLFMDGKLKVDLNAIDEILTRVEQLSSEEYKALLEKQFAEKFATKMNVINAYQSADTRTLESFVEKALERKETIRADFEKFYAEMAKRAGVDWTPSWASAVEEAAKVAEPAAKLALAGDVSTPVTSELAKAIQETHAAGKALHLAGEEINQGQALVWQETGANGQPVLRMELRLERQADARLTKLLEDQAGTPMGHGSMNAVDPADPYIKTIQKAAGTVSHHADDGLYNQAKLDQMIELNKGDGPLFSAIAKADQADSLLSKGEITVDEWVEAKAKGDMATQYKQIINDVQDAAQFQKKVEHIPAFDLDASKAEWTTKAPKTASAPKPGPKLSEPEKLFSKDPVLGQEQRPVTMEGPGYMERVRQPSQVLQPQADIYNVPAGEAKHTIGQQFNATIRVGGQDIKVEFTGWSMTSAVPGKGRLAMEIEGWDGTEAGITKMLEGLQKLGIDSHLATREEEKLTYWQLTTGQMKNSVEYARPSSATGRYQGLKDTIDRIESRVASEVLDTQGKIDVYREEWAKQFGQESVDRAPERIVHIHDLHGREVGFGHFERFDLPEDIRPYMAKSGKQWGIARRANTSKDVFDNTAMAAGNGEKYRIGQNMAGASVPADLATGGATGSFGSMGVTGWQANGPMMVLNPSSVLRRASTFTYGGDGFGSTWLRTERNYLNPERWGDAIGTAMSGPQAGTKEIVARGGYSFFDDMELVGVHSQSEKDALVQVFRDQGVDTLRGIPIEERVVVASNPQMVGVLNKFYVDHPDAYTHSLANPVDLKPGAKAAQKAATAAQAVAPAPVVNAVKGSFEAQKEALNNAFMDWGNSTNSTKAKLEALSSHLTSAGLKSSTKMMQDEFAEWWQKTGQYKGLSQVKSTKSFIAFKMQEVEVKAAVENGATIVDKVTALTNLPNTLAKQDALGELFSTPFKEMVDAFKLDPSTAGGAYGPQFNNWLLEQASKLPEPSTASFTLPHNMGEVPVKLLTDPGMSVGEKVDAIATSLGHEFGDVQYVIESLKETYGFEGAGSISQTFEAMAKEATTKSVGDILGVAAPAASTSYATVPLLGDVDVAMADKLTNVLNWTKTNFDAVTGEQLPLKISEVSVGLGYDVQTTELLLKGAAQEYGIGGQGWQPVIEQWLDDAAKGGVKATIDVVGNVSEQVAKAATEIVGELPGFGGMTQAQLDAFKTVMDTPMVSAAGKIKELGKALGMEDDLASVTEKLIKAKDLYGTSGTEDTLFALAQDAESVSPKAAVEVVAQEIHPGFATYKNVGTYEIHTPVGIIHADDLNSISDAVYKIENGTDTIVGTMNELGSQFGMSYGDMLPDLDKYASEKGLGGFPGAHPEEVLKSFLQDAGQSLGKGIKNPQEFLPPLPSPSSTVAKTLLDPANTAKDPLFYNQPLVESQAGIPVTPPFSSEKIFSYNVNGDKVPVVFSKVSGGGTNVLVQEKYTGQWFLLKGTHSGKTPKDEVLALLKQVGHSSMEPF